MKIAFVTDTGTGQHPDYWKEKGIYCLPLQITCDGESKDEYVEITYSEVIQKLHEKKVTSFVTDKFNLFLCEMLSQVKDAILERLNELRLCIWHLSIQGYDGMLHDICF